MRKYMITLALKQKMASSTTPLLYNWTEHVLSLKSIFSTINCNPELVGDMYNQIEVIRIGCVSLEIVIQLLIKKVFLYEIERLAELVRACACAIGVFQTRWYHYNH
jgi:hypothetical protein